MKLQDHALLQIAELQAAWQSGEPHAHARDSAQIIDVLHRFQKVGTAYCCKHTHHVAATLLQQEFMAEVLSKGIPVSYHDQLISIYQLIANKIHSMERLPQMLLQSNTYTAVVRGD